MQCSNCTNLIGSGSPVCSKCGLPSSESGIQELAEIDERNRSALSSAQTLTTFAAAPLVFIFIAFVAGKFIPESAVSYGFIAAVGLGLFWFKFLRWILEYSNNEYPDESYRRAIAVWQRSAVLAIVGCLLLAALIYAGAS